MKKTSNWFFWDWNSIIKTTIILILISSALAFIFIFPDWKRDSDGKNYEGTTKGQITTIEAQEQVSMTKTGNKTVVYSYTIHYQYQVNSRTYKGIDKVPNSLGNKRITTHLLDKKSSEIGIKYDPKNPKNSQVDF